MYDFIFTYYLMLINRAIKPNYRSTARGIQILGVF